MIDIWCMCEYTSVCNCSLDSKKGGNKMFVVRFKKFHKENMYVVSRRDCK